MSHRMEFAPIWLIGLVIRLVLTLLAFTCRLLTWVLLRVCWVLEAGIDHLRIEHTPQPTPTRESAKKVVPVAQPDDVTRFMKVLGTKDEKFARQLLASGERIRK